MLITKAGFVKYGPSTGLITTDDWFGPMTGTSRGVIDTTNSASYKVALISKKNMSFIKRMSVPTYTRVNGTLWLDGIYARDFTTQKNSTGSVIAKDTTSFGGGSKNGQDP